MCESIRLRKSDQMIWAQRLDAGLGRNHLARRFRNGCLAYLAARQVIRCLYGNRRLSHLHLLTIGLHRRLSAFPRQVGQHRAERKRSRTQNRKAEKNNQAEATPKHLNHYSKLGA